MVLSVLNGCVMYIAGVHETLCWLRGEIKNGVCGLVEPYYIYNRYKLALDFGNGVPGVRSRIRPPPLVNLLAAPIWVPPFFVKLYF